MSRLVPAAAHGALSDADYARCLRHYIIDASSRTWIAAGDTAPALVWDDRAETTRMSQQVAQASAPPALDSGAPSTRPKLARPAGAVDPSATAPCSAEQRYRDQFMQLWAPPPPAAAAAVAASSKAATTTARAAPRRSPEPEYILISEADEADEAGPGEGRGKSGAPASPPSTPSASPPVSQPTPKSAAHRRTAAAKAPRVSASTSPSPRPSTGSSVVFISQPVRKGADGSPAKPTKPRARRSTSASRGREHDGSGEAAGAKRQRSMEEFLYRGD